MHNNSVHANLAVSEQISQPQITIKPSKQWVLPPRPRPGRKPNCSGDHEQGSNGKNNNNDNNCALAKKEKKVYKKKNSEHNSEVIESALKSIKDENKHLKQELSKLVFNLKLLQSTQKEQQQKQQQQQQQLHFNDLNTTKTKKKRNHLEMEREDSLLTAYSSSSSPSDDDFLTLQHHHHHHHYSSEDDEISSQISSAPSLISSTSSFGSHSLLLSNSLSSLSSIKEEESNVLKIDEFLTTSYFDSLSNSSNSMNNNDKHETKVDKMILKEKSNGNRRLSNKKELVMLSPPSLPMKSETDDFEFNFLKTENVGFGDQGINFNDISSNYDSLFDSVKVEEDVFGNDWDWK